MDYCNIGVEFDVEADDLFFELTADLNRYSDVEILDDPIYFDITENYLVNEQDIKSSPEQPEKRKKYPSSNENFHSRETVPTPKMEEEDCFHFREEKSAYITEVSTAYLPLVDDDFNRYDNPMRLGKRERGYTSELENPEERPPASKKTRICGLFGGSTGSNEIHSLPRGKINVPVVTGPEEQRRLNGMYENTVENVNHHHHQQQQQQEDYEKEGIGGSYMDRRTGNTSDTIIHPPPRLPHGGMPFFNGFGVDEIMSSEMAPREMVPPPSFNHQTIQAYSNLRNNSPVQESLPPRTTQTTTTTKRRRRRRRKPKKSPPPQDEDDDDDEVDEEEEEERKGKERAVEEEVKPNFFDPNLGENFVLIRQKYLDEPMYELGFTRSSVNMMNGRGSKTGVGLNVSEKMISSNDYAAFIICKEERGKNKRRGRGRNNNNNNSKKKKREPKKYKMELFGEKITEIMNTTREEDFLSHHLRIDFKYVRSVRLNLKKPKPIIYDPSHGHVSFRHDIVKCHFDYSNMKIVIEIRVYLENNKSRSNIVLVEFNVVHSNDHLKYVVPWKKEGSNQRNPSSSVRIHAYEKRINNIVM